MKAALPNDIISFKIIATPKYKAETITADKLKAIERIEEALRIVEKIIKEKKGTFKILTKP